jgi:hypothetical protein
MGLVSSRLELVELSFNIPGSLFNILEFSDVEGNHHEDLDLVGDLYGAISALGIWSVDWIVR